MGLLASMLLRHARAAARRGTGGLQAAWRQLDTCLRNDLDNSKPDALIDHLCIFHARNPNGRAVVVAK